jgi:riboflavin synthase
MFTGIVEERGEVLAVSGHRLSVRCAIVSLDSGIGASVAVNGVCLTVIENTGDSLSFDLSEETLARTSLRRLRRGAPVNLERPVSLSTRLGGHMVQGHVDGVGEVVGVVPDGPGGARMRLTVPDDPPANPTEKLMAYVVEKGSIGVDGVSLTVAALHEDGVTVALIPHTLAVTTLGSARPGDPVNLEVDIIAKYVARSVALNLDTSTRVEGRSE